MLDNFKTDYPSVKTLRFIIFNRFSHEFVFFRVIFQQNSLVSLIFRNYFNLNPIFPIGITQSFSVFSGSCIKLNKALKPDAKNFKS